VCTFEVFCILQHNFKFTQFPVQTVTRVTAVAPTEQVHVFAIGGGIV